MRATETTYPLGTRVMVKIDDEPWQPAIVIGHERFRTFRGEYVRFIIHTGAITRTVTESKIKPVGLVPA